MKFTNKKTLYWFFVLAMFLIIILLIMCLVKNIDFEGTMTEDIVIGYISDQSVGGVANFGISGLYGLEVAVEEINAHGGIMGKKVRIISRDDKQDKELSKQYVEDFIFNQKVVAIIGPGNSANAFNWIHIPQENEVPVIVHIATASAITQKYADRPRNYIFRVSLSEIEQVRLSVAWTLNKTKNGKVAIIHDSTGYGLNGLKDISGVLGRWGKTFVSINEFDREASEQELIEIIESVKQSEADAVYFFALADSNIKLMRAMEKVEDYDPVIIGTAANLVPEIWSELGVLGSKINFPASIELNEAIIELKDKIVKKHGILPTTTTASQSYDAAYMIKAAIEKAESTKGVDIRDALETIENVQGSFKLYEKPFSKENHEALTAWDIFMAHWVDGEIIRIEDDFTELDIR